MIFLDTEHLYTKAYQDVVGKFDKIYTWDLKVKMMGRSRYDGYSMLISELNIPISVDEIASQMEKISKELFPKAELMEGN